MIPEYDTCHSQAVSGPRQPTVSIHLSIETDAKLLQWFLCCTFAFFPREEKTEMKNALLGFILAAEQHKTIMEL